MISGNFVSPNGHRHRTLRSSQLRQCAPSCEYGERDAQGRYDARTTVARIVARRLYHRGSQKRAVEIISELESHTRGAYCGSVFVLAGNGWMQSSIAIRTLEINDQHLHCWGVAASRPARNGKRNIKKHSIKSGPSWRPWATEPSVQATLCLHRAQYGRLAWLLRVLPALDLSQVRRQLVNKIVHVAS